VQLLFTSQPEHALLSNYRKESRLISTPKPNRGTVLSMLGEMALCYDRAEQLRGDLQMQEMRWGGTQLLGRDMDRSGKRLGLQHLAEATQAFYTLVEKWETALPTQTSPK
jgi:hypothetical protein